jgi:hypothetical protein
VSLYALQVGPATTLASVAKSVGTVLLAGKSARTPSFWLFRSLVSGPQGDGSLLPNQATHLVPEPVQSVLGGLQPLSFCHHEWLEVSTWTLFDGQPVRLYAPGFGRMGLP